MINFFRNNQIKKITKQRKYVILPAVEINQLLIDNTENIINAFFKKTIYQGLIKILIENKLLETQKEVLNNRPEIIDYIKNNTILYDRDGFIYTNGYQADTNLTKAMQSIGAQYDGVNKKWIIQEWDLPQEIREAITKINNVKYTTQMQLNSFLQFLPQRSNVFLQEFQTKFKQSYVDIIKDTIEQNQQNLTESGIAINLKFEQKYLDTIADEYSNNLNLTIKNFTNAQVVDLRTIIEENVNRGLRKEQLINLIQDRYNISKNKASFLARQETALLTSNIQKQNMLRAGIDYYMWDSSRDSKVRPAHAELNKKIFKFSDLPPIVNEKTKARAHPGEDYNCRCVARPIVVGIENLRAFYENGYTYYKLSEAI